MSIGESIEAYLSIFDRIFQKKRDHVTVTGNTQVRFDSEVELAIKEVITKRGLQEDALLKHPSDYACKV